MCRVKSHHNTNLVMPNKWCVTGMRITRFKHKRKDLILHSHFQNWQRWWPQEGLTESLSLLGVLQRLRAASLIRKMPVPWPYILATTKIREIFLVNSGRTMLQDWNREQNEVVLLLMISLWNWRRKAFASKERHFNPGHLFLVTLLV